MCGIVAQFNFDGAPPDVRKIKAMSHDIRHRGPDDDGIYMGEWFGLGHRRLSILDLGQGGHQPMLDEGGRFVIAYNGEIYNYRELREELKRKCSFQSLSDTEVVLKSWMVWGKDCLTRFVGMFAFIIVDLVGKKVFAARDQLGIKPLYFFETSKSIYFSSEIKSFRHVIRFEVNEDALFEQFMYRYVSGERTIFKHIRRLPPGSLMEFTRQGSPCITRYYDVCDGLKDGGRGDINYNEIEQRLFESIKIHTVSDVGYNIQLSGGIDSSYITAVLSRECDQALHTFSVELSGFEDDESAYQQVVTEKFGTHHHGFDIGAEEMTEHLPKATWYMDLPIVHTSCVFLMLLCDHSVKHSKVILTGEGADELFGGYGRYNIPRVNRWAFQLKRAGVRPGIFPKMWKFRGLRNFLSMDVGVDEQIFIPRESERLYTSLSPDIVYRKGVSGGFSDLLKKIVASDQTSYLNSLFERQDKMSMAASVEARVPFCIPSLFDYVNRIDPWKKIRPVPKSILKKLSERYFDNKFIYRNKNGFLLPTDKWLKDKKLLGKYIDLLTDKTFNQRGYYNAGSVGKAVDQHLYGEKDRTKELMNLIKFEIWHRMFIDQQGRDIL